MCSEQHAMAAARRMHQVVYRGGASLAYAGADGRDGAQLAVKSAATGVPPRAWAQPNLGLLVGPKGSSTPKPTKFAFARRLQRAKGPCREEATAHVPTLSLVIFPS